MKIVKEAYTENCKIVFDPEYVTIGHLKGEPIHIALSEAKEIVEWLSHELNRVLPETIKVPSWEETAVKDLAKLPRVNGFPVASTDGKAYTGGKAPLESRSAVLSDVGKEYAEKVGNPFLASNAPNKSVDGRQAILGMEVTDLGAVAQANGLPIIRK